MLSILEELVKVFSGSDGYIAIGFFIAGMILLFFELCIPGFGICGISGIGILILGMVYRVITGIDFIQLVIMFLAEILTIVVLYLIVIRSIKRGLLSKTQLFSSKNSIPTDYGIRNNRKFLIGKIGVIETSCKPVGKAVIDGQIYEVISKDKYLDKNTQVRVTSVVGDAVEVSEI